MGKRDQPFYRIVVAEEASKRDGKIIENLGYYQPKPEKVQLDRPTYDAWIKKGAQPTDAVRKLIGTPAA